MERYKYRPLRFYATCFYATWMFWIPAAVISKSQNDNSTAPLLMLLGLTAPAVTSVITVSTSGSKVLKADLKRKLVGFYRIKPFSILEAVAGFMAIIKEWGIADTLKNHFDICHRGSGFSVHRGNPCGVRCVKHGKPVSPFPVGYG